MKQFWNKQDAGFRTNCSEWKIESPWTGSQGLSECKWHALWPVVTGRRVCRHGPAIHRCAEWIPAQLWLPWACFCIRSKEGTYEGENRGESGQVLLWRSGWVIGLVGVWPQRELQSPRQTDDEVDHTHDELLMNMSWRELSVWIVRWLIPFCFTLSWIEERAELLWDV